MAEIPVYIRYGEIPANGKSKIYFGDALVGEEPGVSVWETYRVDNVYFPKLPDEPNENAVADYFDYLLNRDKRVYLVTGNRIRVEGHDREPLLEDVKIIRELTYLEGSDK